jgi:hypothetical protein
MIIMRKKKSSVTSREASDDKTESSDSLDIWKI